MDDATLQLLAGLPEHIDALTDKVRSANERLKEQVRVTQGLLAELGIARAQPSVAVSQPAPQPAPIMGLPVATPALSKADEEARLEQLRYLEARRAQREALVAQMRSGE